MPQVEAAGLQFNYDVQGEGEPLLLIPYTGADHACYAFQLPAYSEHFSCICGRPARLGRELQAAPAPTRPTRTPTRWPPSWPPRGSSGRTWPASRSAAAVATHLAARHPERVRSLSLHSGWDRTDAYLRALVEMWRSLAHGLPTVADVVIQAIFPFCFTAEMYNEKPDFVQGLVDFVRSRPAQPLEAFLAQTDAVLAHDASAVLGRITAPTQITFGARDICTSTRFAEPLHGGIAGSELVVFDHLSHAALHEDAETFNRATLDFLLRHQE